MGGRGGLSRYGAARHDRSSCGWILDHLQLLCPAVWTALETFRSAAIATAAATVSAAATASKMRDPMPRKAPASAAPLADAATFSPAIDTKTCARAVAGAYCDRAARVAVKNGALAIPRERERRDGQRIGRG